MKYGGYDFSEMLTNYIYIYKNEYRDKINKIQEEREILHFKYSYNFFNKSYITK